MAMQVLGQSGGSSLFSGNTNLNMTLSNDMYDFSELSKAELAAPQLIMLANVALTGEVNGNCCDYMVGEERQMAELTTVGNANFSDSDGEGMDDSQAVERGHEDLNDIDMRTLGSPDVRNIETTETTESSSSLTCSLDKGYQMASSCQLSGTPDDFQLSGDSQGFELSGDPEGFDLSDVPEGFQLPNAPENVDDRGKSLKNKPFRCKPCQYEAESEQEFVHHIRVHSAKRFIVEEKTEKHSQVDSSTTDEVDFSKGPIRCDRCGYNTNRYDHYLAHLKHHNKAGENEKVYKCTICTYTTISEYHWKKHLRNHFPRKVYTCLQCSYFSDRKNNYVQHIRTHTGERPYRCTMCPYSSSQKTHLTRHMRTHSGEKPFKCEQCSYVASNQHEVTRHARQVHDGPKPLACPHCEYKTADRSNFKKHVELHVSPRQFLCPVCEYAASKKCNLQYHIKSRHPDCCDITMDVSKVRLRTKKNEANTSESVSSDNNNNNNKMEQVQVEKEVTEKKNETATNEEKKENLSKEEKKENVSKDEKKENLSKEKKVGLDKVTTRSRKTISKSKEADIKTETMAEKTGKTKKLKRKAETNSAPLTKETDDVIAKKKKKSDKKSPKCQDSEHNDSKLEDTKKQNACLKKNKKKKELKNKPVSNNRKPDSENIVDEDLVPKEPLLGVEDKMKTCNGPCSEQQPIPSDTEENQVVSGETIEDLEPPSTQPVDKNVELEMKDQEMLVAEEGTAKAVFENEIGIDRAGTSQISSVNLNATLEKETAMLEDTLPDVTQNIHATQIDEMEMLSNPAVVQGTQPMETCERETVSSPLQDDDSSTEELQAEDPAAGASPSRVPEKPQQSTKTGLVSAASGGTVMNESQEMEEDEGIHSHDGSDISDNISEGSDDSGLNGARTAQEKTSQKTAEEMAETKVTKENYVCIFCDRSFKKESEYSKHLKRHLVNVYYLEKATKGQG